MALSYRLATMDDYPALKALMNLSIAQLLKPFLTPAEVEASYEVMGVDTRLIKDQSYFVIEENGQIVGCGGWSFRETLYGGDHSDGRNPRMLDPKTEPARIRAMYTHPDHTRKGVGTMVMDLCEQAAKDKGFTVCEMAATMAGVPLYTVCGYETIKEFHHTTSSGIKVPLAQMQKTLDP